MATVRDVLGDAGIDIYEAGGAMRPTTSGWFINSSITVVDLECGNVIKQNNNISYIQGDIRNFCPEHKEFDFIVCNYVLEHVRQPEMALRNFCELSRPGGLIFIASPCFWSLNAFVAKLTPFWFHVWFYRKILGKVSAGKKGKAPFPTYHSSLIDPGCLAQFFRSNGLEVIYSRKFLNHNYLILIKSYPLLASILEILTLTLNLILRKKHDFGEGDFHLIVKKPNSVNGCKI